MSNSISVENLQKMIEEQEQICLLDVRKKADYERSPAMVEGAAWCDPEKVVEWRDTLPMDRKIVVYCVKGGQVSQSVANTLAQTHPEISFLEGGILGWEERQKNLAGK